MVTLTDEEIVAVDGLESVAPRLWYDAQPEAVRATAVEVAARGLAARGWASADPTATSAADLGLEAVGPLRAVLGLRRPARSVLVAEQRTAAGTRARVYYLRADGMALEEAVNSGGLHRFSTLTMAHACSGLAAWCDPLDTPSPLHPCEVEVESEQALEETAATYLGATTLVTLIGCFFDDGLGRRVEHYLSVFAGDSRLTLGGRDEGALRLRDAGRQSLLRRLHALAAPAVPLA